MNNILPSGWESVKLEEICDTISGGTPDRKYPQYFCGNIPWEKSGELVDNIIKTEDLIPEEALENSNAKIIQKGTLLIAWYGATVGKTGALRVDAAINQAICAITPPKEYSNNFYTTS